MPKRKKEITWGGARTGAGRPPLPPEQRRPRPPRARITFDLEPEQAELVDAKADAQGVSRAAYIRALVLADIGVTDPAMRTWTPKTKPEKKDKAIPPEPQEE